MIAAHELAEFVVSATPPEKALTIARSSFLDTIGVALAGAVEPGSRIVQKLAGGEGC